MIMKILQALHNNEQNKVLRRNKIFLGMIHNNNSGKKVLFYINLVHKISGKNTQHFYCKAAMRRFSWSKND